MLWLLLYVAVGVGIVLYNWHRAGTPWAASVFVRHAAYMGVLWPLIMALHYVEIEKKGAP